MRQTARVVVRFQGYTLEDCQCKYCLHYRGKRKPCPLKRCCCEEEKIAAIRRMEQEYANQLTRRYTTLLHR